MVVQSCKLAPASIQVTLDSYTGLAAKPFLDLDVSINLFEQAQEMNAARTSEKSGRALMNDLQTKREADRAQANREELTQRIAQVIRQDGAIEPLKGLHFNRYSSPSECLHNVSIPAFCVIAQGSKEVLLGSDRYQY